MVNPALIEPRLQTPVVLTNREFADLVQFVKTGLLDDRVKKSNLCGIDSRAGAERPAGTDVRRLSRPVTTR